VAQVPAHDQIITSMHITVPDYPPKIEVETIELEF